MIEEVSKSIYRLPIPLPGNPLKELNAYLIKGKDRNLLIDTGFRDPICREALFSHLAELGVGPGDMDVLLTHFHPDHTGLCMDVTKGKGSIYISSADQFVFSSEEEWQSFSLKSDKRYISEGFPENLIQHIAKASADRFMIPPRNVTYSCINDGEILDVGGYKLQCILTPGHSPGHMCFWLEEQGIMFLGDHVLFDITPNIMFWDDTPNALAAYQESLKKIREYDVALPLPGHRSKGDLRQRIDTLLMHNRVRLDEALSIVRRNPGITAYVLAGKMTWRIRARNWEEFPLSQKWFAVGETIAHLEHLENEGVLRRDIGDDFVKWYSI